MVFVELPKEMVNLILSGTPNPTNYSWLTAYPCHITGFINNPVYSNRIVGASIMASGAIVNGIITV